MASESDDEGFLSGAGSANKGLFADVLATPRGEKLFQASFKTKILSFKNLVSNTAVPSFIMGGS